MFANKIKKRKFASTLSVLASQAAFSQRLLCEETRACHRRRSVCVLGEGMASPRGPGEQVLGSGCEKHDRSVGCIGKLPVRSPVVGSVGRRKPGSCVLDFGVCFINPLVELLFNYG